EPFRVEFIKAGPPAELKAYLDGQPLELTDGKAEIRNQMPGTHLLESVLLDEEGVEIQRSGHVFRVGEKPTVLCIGLAAPEYERAISLAPDMNFRQTEVSDFGGADLQLTERAVEMVLLSVDALNRLSADQCFSLASFVARGGGLFVTGDGAKYVAPEYMTADARNLLPVMLQKEGKKPPPDDPPVEEEVVKAEIAKVSICFVLDRSYSMTATIGTSNKTRWKVASTGVVESIRLVELGGKRDAKEKRSESYATRIGVMGFTLKQQWVYEMNNVYPHERNQIEKTLERMGTELTEIERDDFDAQGYNTDIYAAMSAAIDTMKEERSAVKVIVMMTDGADRDQNTIEGKKHADLRADAIANDINIITVGIGTEFDGTTPSSRAAKSVIKDLATRSEYVHIASSPQAAEKANVIFVDSVELAFEAYDDKKKREDEERKRRLEEQKNKELEPPKVDVLPGVFPLVLGPVGEQLFGADALPVESPKVAWVARSKPRDGSAVALAAATDDLGATPVLAFQGYGLGRVGFWGAGTDPEALGELTGWADFPAIFASSLRWLLPREEPDLRLVDEASPDGVRIL
ncbi:MAG: VWA domain-containing protein, partial [Planctomycetes bacterium]|nr:VWA domain-containing protein [Planctomycetota bacterium]